MVSYKKQENEDRYELTAARIMAVGDNMSAKQGYKPTTSRVIFGRFFVPACIVKESGGVL